MQLIDDRIFKPEWISGASGFLHSQTSRGSICRELDAMDTGSVAGGLLSRSNRLGLQVFRPRLGLP